MFGDWDLSPSSGKSPIGRARWIMSKKLIIVPPGILIVFKSKKLRRVEHIAEMPKQININIVCEIF
jgi:hypothetical protein